MKLSPHFDRSELACPCGCGFDTVDAELLKVLELVRSHFQRPVIITSGCRCKAHNDSPAVGGGKKSQHLYGRAADIQVVGTLPSKVYQWLDETFPRQYGLGKYTTFTHIDTRTNGPARWG